MAYKKFYYGTDWQNLPSQKTALNRKNLIHLENGVEEADNRIIHLDESKADLSLLNTMVKDVTLGTKTGILTVTLLDGTTKSYDLDIERVVTNFDINDDNELVLTLADGTQKVINLTRFVYSVESTATISMTITDRTMTASIINGSVTMEKLDSAIQTEFRQYMLDAQAARDAALNYQKYAKRYSLGDEDFPGSETDNAKYYYEQVKEDAKTSGQNAQLSADSAAVSTTQAGIAVTKAAEATSAVNSTAADVLTATKKANDAAVSEQAAREKAAEASASEEVANRKAEEAEASSLQAKRFTNGGIVPEDAEDNAEWYYKQTKELKAQVDAAAKISIPQFRVDPVTMKLISDTEAKGMRFWYDSGKFYGEETA
ncbi:hypothetical protein [Clostridium sp. E02]|uniref:hypothetical protein n=1 Tax=Clostridium sp. E02 TaxID=2487134 RepID=UPI000F535144|nr:hypothetical protein [Clostridium sp. E02]